MPIQPNDVAEQFTKRFGRGPQYVVRAPGRVNLIGDHTDYNDGFVLPMAIDRAIWIALQPRDDRRIVLHSIEYDQTRELHLDGFAKDTFEWIEYVKAMAWSMQRAGYLLTGFEGVLLGDVPLGAGLASSAAMELATGRALAAAGNLEWEPIPMAKLAQRAEKEWIGVNCGIMDQLVVACGQAGHAALIDCRSLAIQPVPFPPGVAVAVLDTGTRRGLVDSAYNERRMQCESVADFFKVNALRDVSIELFQQLAHGLDDASRCRATHVITENERTLQFAAAMERCETHAFRVLMEKSHNSLCDDFEVSSEALDAIVACALSQEACYGARMTGPGFGGSAVALIQADKAEEFVEHTTTAYQEKTGNQPAVYVCHASDGADVVEGW